jgi:hypothetical protein
VPERRASNSGASTSGSISPRSEAGESAAGAFAPAPASAAAAAAADADAQRDAQPRSTGPDAARRDREGGSGLSLGRKLRNALSDMLVIR